MTSLYPLRFEPIFRRYLWGGRRLGTVLGKRIGAENCAESWEIVDYGEDRSRVVGGPLEGTTLTELVQTHGQELLGRHHPRDRFPLLFKFLDSAKTLSVQVHPNRGNPNPDPAAPPKTEAWIVLDAEPGSLIYAGLKRGFDRPALAREIARGTCDLCLHRFEAQPGDCVFLPSGAIHALGAGLLVAEIQQTSDTTYRIFDWNRVGPDGQPRPLQIEKALEEIDYDLGPINPARPQATNRRHVQRLVECDQFVIDRWEFDEPERIGGDDRFHIIAVLHGAVEIIGDPVEQPLLVGQTAILPASLGRRFLVPDESTTLLDIYLP